MRIFITCVIWVFLWFFEAMIWSFEVQNASFASSGASFEQVRTTVRTVVLPGGVRRLELTGLTLLNAGVNTSVAPTENTSSSPSSNSNIQPQTGQDATEAVRVVGLALNYPNPCRLGKDGTTIGYYLSRDAATELRIYDPFAREIYRKSFASGQIGGRGGLGNAQYNRIGITSTELGTSNIPAGIYFFLIIADGTVLAKGKIAVLP